jgi:hypothetical protein
MSIQTNFPALKPSLLLDFSNTEALDSRVTFSRASTATYYGTQTAKAEENLLTFSQEFDNAAWANQSTTETSGATAPDGTATAFTLDDGVATSSHDIAQNFSGTSGVTYTLSAFFKDVDRQFVILACSSSPNAWASAKFDLTAGTAGSTSASGTGWSTTSSSITSVGNSWYRCTITFVSGITGTLSGRLGMATDGTTFTAAQRGLESYTGTNATVEIWGAQLEQRSAVTAYTVTTTQAITNYIPVLETAASGVARFDHNPTTFESLGLLIEESRTNLLTYSEQFDNAAWTKTRSSITANTVVSPDGTLTGDKIIADTDVNTTHLVSTSASVVSGTSYTVTVYAKAAEYGFVRLALSGFFAVVQSAIFNLSTGELGTTTGTITTSAINAGNGWWRFSLSSTATSTGSTSVQLGPATSASTANFTGDDYSGIYIWGAQLESASFSTSYIPTVASQVTRSADLAVMTGTNFSSWYNQAEGTLYAEANTPAFATTYVFAEINNNSTSNYIRHSTSSAGTTTQFVVVNNTTTTASPSVTVTLGSNRKMAGAYAFNSIQQSVNGSLGTEDTSSEIPTGLVQMNIGSRAAGTSVVNGTIKKIAYYPLRVTNAQLQGLTS